MTEEQERLYREIFKPMLPEHKQTFPPLGRYPWPTSGGRSPSKRAWDKFNTESERLNLDRGGYSDAFHVISEALWMAMLWHEGEQTQQSACDVVEFIGMAERETDDEAVLATLAGLREVLTTKPKP